MAFVAEADAAAGRVRLVGDCRMADLPVLADALAKVRAAAPGRLEVDLTRAGEFAIGPAWLLRSTLEGGRPDAFEERGAEAPAAVGGRVGWSPEALERLERVPSFVRGMVKRIYADWARERGIGELTPEIMDRARTDLGLEGM